jgi:hypothetical protein
MDSEARARCIDIPRGKASAGIVDRIPDEVEPEHRSGWVALRLDQLLRASTQHYGTPLRPYLLFLINRRKQLPEAIRRLQVQFLARAPKLSKRGLQIASQFALLYAGGCLAIEAHVLPWTRELLREALQTCLQAALEHVRRDRIRLKVIRGILERRLQSPSIVEAASGGRFSPGAHPGFYREVDGKRKFTLYAKAFRRWFANATQYRAAVHWLYKAGLLELHDQLITPSVTSTEWAERTPRWPDGRVHRSVVFWDPVSPPSPQGTQADPKPIHRRRALQV